MADKPSLRIYYTDFWHNFEPENNIFYNLLIEKYNVVITENNPDYLFFSVFGNRYKYFNCKRIFFTGEIIRPDMNECDYAFSFFPSEGDPRKYRLPTYYQYGDMSELTIRPPVEEILKRKTKFCNFVYSNPNCKKRNDFFKKLSKYKKVDSAGRFMNNVGFNLGLNVEDKWNFLKPYKFTISFENKERPYYTSEKIYEAMKVDSLPVYWGNPYINLDFNTKSFLNYYDYGSDEELIERIIEIDKNDDLYVEYLKQPFFVNNELNEYVKKENIMKQLEYIINDNKEPVSLKSSIFSANPLTRSFSKAQAEFEYNAKSFLRRLNNLSWSKIRMKIRKLRHGQNW